MPVKFYPNKPLHNLEEYIVKSDNGKPLNGEIDIYRKLYNDLHKSNISWFIWHDLKLPLHSKYSNDLNKKSGQIDFLIISKFGIIILEVKGGNISYRDNTYYYGNFEEKISQDPFRQAEGYKFTLKDHILDNYKKSMFCDAVAFPHVLYNFKATLIDENKLWTGYNSTNKYDNNIEKFLISQYNNLRNKFSDAHFSFSELSEKEIQNIIKILSPIIEDTNPFNNNLQSTIDWLQIQNLEVLKSLGKNSRIMLEGPPGSGKTTLAKAYIDNQINKKGIYICWNRFLKLKIEYELFNHFKDYRCEVHTLSSIIIKYNKDIDFKKFIKLNSNEIAKIVKSTFKSLSNIYDYMIIDEAQDIFDKGFDDIINESLSNGRGLTNGNVLVLYDIDQSYVHNNPQVLELADLYVEYFSHFKLDDVKRTAQNPNLKLLANNIISNDFTIKNTENITIEEHTSLNSIKKSILKNCLTPMRDTISSLYGKDCIVLIESNIYNNGYKGEYVNEELGEIRDVEMLHESNINNENNILKYTSILNYKGLESKNVFLIFPKPNETNKYELYLGITRAINNLNIYILE